MAIALLSLGSGLRRRSSINDLALKMKSWWLLFAKGDLVGGWLRASVDERAKFDDQITVFRCVSGGVHEKEELENYSQWTKLFCNNNLTSYLRSANKSPRILCFLSVQLCLAKPSPQKEKPANLLLKLQQCVIDLPLISQCRNLEWPH